MSKPKAAQELLKIIEARNAKGFSPAEVFGEILEYFMHLFSHGDIPLRVQRDYYQQLQGAIEHYVPFEDMLGDLYMEIHSRWKQSAMGQFFTPEHIAAMIVRLTISEAAITEGKPLGIAEPCSGSGVMILKSAEMLQNNRHLHKWYCSDLDHICVKMTAVQCALNTIPAYVVHMDTLTLETFNGYEVELLRYHGGWLPRIRVLSDEELQQFSKSNIGKQLAQATKEAPARTVETPLFGIEEVEQEAKPKQSKTYKQPKTKPSNEQPMLFGD